MTSPLTTAEIDELEARVAYCEYVHGTYFEGAPIENVLLRRLLASARMGVDGWQDIETAPKDGTRIFATYLMRNGEWRFMVAFWNVYNGEGFWQFGGLKETPTHWCPLPEPPADHVRAALDGRERA